MCSRNPLKVEPDLRRRKELAKIHLGAQAIGLKDDAYRDMLRLVTGKDSAGDLNQAERVKVLEHLKSKGFADRPKPPKRAGTRPRDESAEASKIRALWLALFQLGEVQDSSEAAMEAYVKRMTGKDALRFVSSHHEVDKVIKTLRAWCERVGFQQPIALDVLSINSIRRKSRLDPQDIGFAAKCRLIIALWRRVRAASIAAGQPVPEFVEPWLNANFGVQHAANMSDATCDAAIEELGRWLRRLRKAAK
jgi:phage gp16-like protein